MLISFTENKYTKLWVQIFLFITIMYIILIILNDKTIDPRDIAI
jgi:ABC-type microcin C transport system permease subunit YejE